MKPVCINTHTAEMLVAARLINANGTWVRLCPRWWMTGMPASWTSSEPKARAAQEDACATSTTPTFELSLSPTANDMRRLAQIVTALADQMQQPACAAVTAAEAA